MVQILLSSKKKKICWNNFTQLHSFWVGKNACSDTSFSFWSSLIDSKPLNPYIIILSSSLHPPPIASTWVSQKISKTSSKASQHVRYITGMVPHEDNSKIGLGKVLKRLRHSFLMNVWASLLFRNLKPFPGGFPTLLQSADWDNGVPNSFCAVKGAFVDYGMSRLGSRTDV